MEVLFIFMGSICLWFLYKSRNKSNKKIVNEAKIKADAFKKEYITINDAYFTYGLFQQDDIKDAEINPIKQKHRYVSMEHKKAVKAHNKSHAILLFKERYNITVKRKDIK